MPISGWVVTCIISYNMRYATYNNIGLVWFKCFTKPWLLDFILHLVDNRVVAIASEIKQETKCKDLGAEFTFEISVLVAVMINHHHLISVRWWWMMQQYATPIWSLPDRNGLVVVDIFKVNIWCKVAAIPVWHEILVNIFSDLIH